MKTIHLMYVPFTGLGLYGGFRGNRWLKNRIKVFKQFVVPSLLAQTDKDFVLWISWRPEERDNPHVIGLRKWLAFSGLRVVHTFYGVCFYDDKYPPEVARERLFQSIRGSVIDLVNIVGDCEHVFMTIQPSDDCYCKDFVAGIKEFFAENDEQAVGFEKGYIMNYQTKELCEYTPSTNPPFYTIKFPRKDFLEPLNHLVYTSLKKDVGQYKKGTPLPSHEYVKDCLKYAQVEERGFLVGTHGENISTYFNHPFKGERVSSLFLTKFGLLEVEPIKIRISLRKAILKRLPFKIQRKLRYWLGERLWQSLYEFLRT